MIATIALVAWPIVALYLFQTRPLNQAILWTILGALLLLPAGTVIKIPGIPVFDKSTIPNLTAFPLCMLAARRSVRFSNGFGLAEVLLLMFLVGPFITSELNGDPIVIAHRTFLPSVGHYDALSSVVSQFLLLLPFFLGRQFLRTSEDNVEILRILVIAGLLYSLPMLFEIRMSPQLNNWVYGYTANNSFIQEIRDGSYRPRVFMGHGLIASLFLMTTAVAAATFWRTQTRVGRFPPVGITAYLSTVLVLCKSMGAVVYGAALVPLVRWTKPRIQIRVALIMASIAVLYPLLRSADLVPAKLMVEVASSISPERGNSLEIRLDQEQKLLDHASERLLFGWGRFGRGRVHDAVTGDDVSVTDGHWAITLGTFGLFGFLAEFGLLALPVFRAAFALRFAELPHERVMLASLALIVATNTVDLLPNSVLTPWTWLLAGALLGRTEVLRSLARRRAAEPMMSLTLSTPEIRQQNQM